METDNHHINTIFITTNVLLNMITSYLATIHSGD